MGAMVSQISSLTIVYSVVHSGADQRKLGTRKMFPFENIIMSAKNTTTKIMGIYI